MYNYSDIQQVHLEITTRCNAACPGCPRNLCGVNVIDDYPLHSMSLAEAQHIFTPVFLKQLTKILINGNLGDFVTAKDGLEIVKYFRSQNSNLTIQISSNASARPEIWAELARLNTEVIFCIDGLKHTHEMYRTQTNWDHVIANALSFINAGGGKSLWKMIQFAHNRHEIDQCRELSKTLKFSEFYVVDHGRDNFPVFNQNQEFLHSIGDPNHPRDFNQIHDQHKQSVYEFDTEPAKISCQVKKRKSVYITATGEVYPCCWLGFYPRQMKHPGNSQIVPLLPSTNNANEIGIESAIKWFDSVEQSWNTNQLSICKSICGVKQ